MIWHRTEILAIKVKPAMFAFAALATFWQHVVSKAPNCVTGGQIRAVVTASAPCHNALKAVLTSDSVDLASPPLSVNNQTTYILFSMPTSPSFCIPQLKPRRSPEWLRDDRPIAEETLGWTRYCTYLACLPASVPVIRLRKITLSCR